MLTREQAIVTKDGRQLKVPTIDDVVRWSKTGKGAREQTATLFNILPDDGLLCESGAGMCE